MDMTTPSLQQRGSAAVDEPSRGWRPELLGVTATGPVFRVTAPFVIVPFASAFWMLRELATKVDEPQAPVVSTLARRLVGREAHRTWIDQSIRMTALLSHAGRRGRLAFLRQVLDFVHGTGSVEGLEPVLAAAVNGAWPWLSMPTTDRLLDDCSAMLQRSRFARRHEMAIVDPTARTVSLFGPGALATLDVSAWRNRRALDQDEFISGRAGLGPQAGQLTGTDEVGALIDRLLGGGGSATLDDLAAGLMGNDSQGVPGGLRDIGDLRGRGTAGQGGRQSPGVDDPASSLRPNSAAQGVPGGLPSLGDLPGTGVSEQGGSSRAGGQLADLTASIPGSESRGLSGWIERHGTGGFAAGGFAGATPGGPFAPTGRLGTNAEGNESWDSIRDVATGVAIISATVIAVIVAPEITIPLGIAAVAGGGAGGALVGLGLAEGVNESNEKKPPEKPHSGDLYPDPDYSGGGSPSRLPDHEGGGGTPNTMWDENGGGGRPNSLWDDGFGKPGPTVAPAAFTLRVLAGSGLLANVVQTGPATLRF